MPKLRQPVVRTVSLNCSVEQAFESWTCRIDIWWPVARISASGDAAARVVLEARVGGRIYERTPAGTEHDWGRIIRFDPPRRLSFTWFMNADPERASEVDVRFQEQDGGTTRVTVEHGKWERADPSVAETHRACVAAPEGWTDILESYKRAREAPKP